MGGYRDFFEGKRVTLMGLGLLGRGVGDAAFLAPMCRELVVTDRKAQAELASSLEQLKHYKNIRFALGGHTEGDFTHTDMVIKAAGVPLSSPYIEAARAAGVPVYMSTALFAKFAREAGAKIVGITGTRGKSTVTHMIYHVLARAALRDASGRAKNIVLGGNVRGLSTLAMLPEVVAGDIAVLELDSWQLQGFGDLGMSPDVAVFTNLMEDHLNYYPSMDAYFADKANIFKYQKEGDATYISKNVLDTAGPGGIPWWATIPAPIPADWRLCIPGTHNRENAAFAVAALRRLGVGEEDIRAGVESFEGVEGRLQKVATMRGVNIYNDNNATTPDATLAALKAFKTGVILIAGGSDKGLSLDALAAAAASCKAVVLLPGGGTDKLKPLLPEYVEQANIADALAAAVARATPGDSVLFSPGFASFGMFANEYERNDAFVNAVKKLS